MTENMGKRPSGHRKTEKFGHRFVAEKLCSLDGGTGVRSLQTWRSSGKCRLKRVARKISARSVTKLTAVRTHGGNDEEGNPSGKFQFMKAT